MVFLAVVVVAAVVVDLNTLILSFIHINLVFIMLIVVMLHAPMFVCGCYCKDVSLLFVQICVIFAQSFITCRTEVHHFSCRISWFLKMFPHCSYRIQLIVIQDCLLLYRFSQRFSYLLWWFWCLRPGAASLNVHVAWLLMALLLLDLLLLWVITSYNAQFRNPVTHISSFAVE